MVPRHFIKPAAPQTRASSPIGKDWIHEIKFDGWRLQVHRIDGGVQLLSRNGKDIKHRFPTLATALNKLAARDCVIDAELVAVDEQGRCDFAALHRRKKTALCVRAFDLLAVDGTDMKKMPLLVRRLRLTTLVKQSQIPELLLSEAFNDPAILLAELELLGLEGVVSKRKTAPYVSGPGCGWIKVKTETWKRAHAGRGKMFEKANAGRPSR